MKDDISAVNRSLRILSLFESLMRRKVINKAVEAKKFGVDPKTIYRDLCDINSYLSEGNNGEAIYSRKKGGFFLADRSDTWLTNPQVLAVARILLESRAFNREEMNTLLEGLIKQSNPNADEFRQIKMIIGNENLHYCPLQHNANLIETIWDLSEAARTSKLVELNYRAFNKQSSEKRVVEALSVLFSDYYFYLIARRTDRSGDYQIPYRLDRIKSYDVLEQHFKKKHFEDGDFKKKIQFMQRGNLQRVKLKCKAYIEEFVKDRLPTAKVVERRQESGEEFIYVELQVYGDGIIRWLLGQEDGVEVLEPRALREEMALRIERMRLMYQGVKAD